MRASYLTRTGLAALLIAGPACAGNNDTNDMGAATRDSAQTAVLDSAKSNQTESGVTDSSGRSTLGPGVEQTRPDQGEPVTSKGDTINTAIDSSTTPQ
ncbi:MAG TPA: hypothetical protein VEB59_11840 [Gemmatimonadales bacterium]|nr:hypothetical protein [Gemmatimonadales bacterium]